jgi:hypothetical protein
MLSVTDKSRMRSDDQQRYTLSLVAAIEFGVSELQPAIGFTKWNSGMMPKGQFGWTNPSICPLFSQAR